MSPIVAKLLEDRGITAADLEFYLQPTIDKLAKPEELPGIVEAADFILDSVVYRLLKLRHYSKKELKTVKELRFSATMTATASARRPSCRGR